MKVYLSTIGCRLNQSEIETIGRQLLSQGHELVADPGQADSIVINTCAVTNKAARDARTQTRRIHRRNPDARIFLTGCYATIAPAELRALPGAPQLISNTNKDRLVQIIDPHANGQTPAFEKEPILRDFLNAHMGNTRAFVKVQDGCDNRCTFCVTTVARGASVSRQLGDIVAEIQALSSAGYKEVVLTGVHLGSYGKDLADRNSLKLLVKAILAHSDIPRLRISSLEPWDIDPDFFELWQDRRLLPHLHMPLQSGSDAILRRMARRTTRESFRRLVSAARDTIRDLSLSTDIIVGFPGESERDFLHSMDYIREMNFSRLHVFSYSSRPGTAAAEMSGHVDSDIKKDRTSQMISLGRTLSHEFHKGFEGQTRAVLWESSTGADLNGLLWAGYTDNYIRVQSNGSLNLFNKVVPARLLKAQPDKMIAALPDSYGE